MRRKIHHPANAYIIIIAHIENAARIICISDEGLKIDMRLSEMSDRPMQCTR